MHLDRPLLGIGLMLGFCLTAPFADALAKLLGPSIAVGQLVLLRFVIQAAILVPLTVITGRPWKTDGRVLALIVFRTGLHVAGIATFFTALLYLPLADAVAITYVMPFILLLLGHWFLREEIGWRRIAACVVGFLGALLVVQPAFETVGWPALLPVVIAFIFALFMLVTRRIAAATDPIGMQALSAMIALSFLLPAIILNPFGSVSALEWRHPSLGDWMLILVMGVSGTASHLFMTWSLRFAPASTVAPMQYLEIPFATLVGYAFFSDFPSSLALVGIALTIGAGLFVILRERHLAQTATMRPDPNR